MTSLPRKLSRFMTTRRCSSFAKRRLITTSQARQILSQANFTEIVRITPKKAAYHPANLKLPEVRLAVQTDWWHLVRVV